MSPNMRDFDGLTYFSAIDQAGLLPWPVIGLPAAFLKGRELHYDPTAPPAEQRRQCIGQIAKRCATKGGGSVAEYIKALGAALLPA